MAGRLTPTVLALAVLAVAPLARAQLADPTRPPFDAAAPAAGAASPPAMTGLQSVILRKKGKPAALINGEIVELGGKVGESRLVKVNEDGVVLRGPGGEEVLRLTPAAEKKVEKVGAGRAATSVDAGKKGSTP